MLDTTFFFNYYHAHQSIINPFHMKKTIVSKVCLAGAVFGLAFTAGLASAQITLISTNINNGGFESTLAGGKQNFTFPTSATGAVAYWGSLGSANDSDSGAQVGGNVVYQGTNGCYFKPGEGAFNLVTDYTIATGDLFTLTYFAYDTNPNGTTAAQTVTLFSQANPTGPTYSYAPIATLATRVDNLVQGAPFTEYTLTYTALAGDAGNDIGVSIANTAGGDYTAADNFTLTVSPVPEPSTYALLGAGVFGLLAMRRLRRASV
jgi:PEP-CTERM motif